MTTTFDHEVADLKRRLDEALAERDEAEAQNTAMAEVLEIINSSPDQLGPVFDAILEHAVKLCDAAFGVFWTYDGERLNRAALLGAPEPYADYLGNSISITESAVYADIVEGENFVHIADLTTSDAYRAGNEFRRATVDLGKAKTGLAVPLRGGKALLGIFAVFRREVRPFAEKQITLLRNFAAQAVIAIKNTCLISETRESLEQQTATAGILHVISNSPTDVQPTFEAIVDSAAKLCDAEFSAVAQFKDGLLHLVATNNLSQEETAAFHSLFPRPALPNFLMGRAFVEARPVQLADVLAEADYDARTRQVLQSASGYRTFMAVPIFRAGEPIGVIGCARRRVKPFTATQIELLNTFAEQAAIALGNVRLFTELDARNRDLAESLEYQTATSDVLQVISRSAFDLQAVLNTLSETAARLCAAELGFMTRRDGDAYRFVTAVGSTPETAADAIRLKESVLDRQSFIAGRGSITGRVIFEATAVQITDLAADPEYTLNELITVGKIRTLLGVPLMREDAVIGTMSLGRQRVEPFTERQIDLVRTFADQAVIALENARLIGETRDALEQQTATAEVLGVINSSPGNLGPVFDAMLEKAMRLCDAAFGGLGIWRDERFEWIADRGLPPAFAEYIADKNNKVSVGSRSGFAHVAHGDGYVQFSDISTSGFYKSGEPYTRAIVDLGGARTTLSVPLVKDDGVIGVFGFFRQEVRPFAEKQIALVQNFAAQAVIAMENARLITETHEALDQQTATAEVLAVINASPGDLAPVFDAILEKAHTLCGAEFGGLLTYDGEFVRLAAERNLPPAWAELVRGPWRPRDDHPVSRMIRGERLFQIDDMAELASTGDDPMVQAAVEQGGIRTLLLVPLRKDDAFLGYITAYRQEVRPFTDNQIALLQNFAAQAVIAMENARLITETREALAQQTATAEVLGVINSSPGDLGPVFGAMLEKAQRLCEANFGIFWERDGDLFYPSALCGVPAAFANYLKREPLSPTPNSGLGRAAAGEPFVHIADIADSDAYRLGDAQRRALVDLGGGRTALWVGLRKESTVIGVFTIYRQEVRSFSDKQIALLENFAAQAVIAMENARLLGELRQRTDDLQESLEYQTATSDVLKVISRSTFDLQLVLDTLVETAARICQADHACMFRLQDDYHRLAASYGGDADYLDYLKSTPFVRDRGTLSGRAALERRVVHIEDAAADPEYTHSEFQRRGNLRTGLGVPLLRDDTEIGVLVLYRFHVEPFKERQIDLVRAFADQAVIAIENARLITETREALEQQTATAEVLQVINASPGDLAPVFNSMLQKAMRLCGASFGELRTYDGERFPLAATYGVPAAYTEYYSRHDTGRYGPGTGPALLLAGERVVHISDLVETEPYQRGDPDRRAIVDLAGARSYVLVPLLLDETVRGFVLIYRREAGRFTDKQITLLQNFAAQAVIAMENARLITETREALEQQTATSEILRVIARSPTSVQPVFDAIVSSAVKLCEAEFSAVARHDGTLLDLVAVHSTSPQETAAFHRLFPRPLSRDFAMGRAFVDAEPVHFDDLLTWDDYDQRTRERLPGSRSFLAVPIFREGRPVGVIGCGRREVKPFTGKQVDLLKTFADQAAIAIENVRLFNELETRNRDFSEALDQQTATAEVLGVINSSPGNLGPVFEVMVERAMRLCDAANGELWTCDGDEFRPNAIYGDPEYVDWARKRPPFRAAAHTVAARMLSGENVIHIADCHQEDAYRLYAGYRELMDVARCRTLLTVALRKDEKLLGMISAYRSEVRPFSDKQIALLQNFAAQAVIAMENARLISETREALEQQTATSEVLGVINSSPGNLTPIFDVILEKAHLLCGATHGSLGTYDGDYFFRTVATRGYPDPLAERLRQGFDGLANPVTRPLIDGARYVHIPDLAEVDHPIPQAVVRLGGFHTGLFLPLRKDRRLVGHISVARSEVRPFAVKEIALLENFAAQAVIAMENARLITETREALEQQTATAEVLGVINASPGNLAPVFDAMLEKALRLCEATYGVLWTYDGESFHASAMRGVPAAFAVLATQGPHPVGASNVHGMLLRGEAVVHLPDAAASDAYRSGDPLRRALVDLGGARTVLGVPLRKDGVLLGAFIIYRQEVRPFAEKQITLLQSFAAQAVIAMENARLLDQIRQRQAELRVTFDNMGDGVVMFDESLRLAAWNRNVQEMLDLPEAIPGERPSYSEYLRILAERGEFGTEDIEMEVSRRLENTEQEFRQERTRPDGRVIEVRRNAVPDGGFVLIYSDITERKRSEAEIHAARDAAEAAYRDLKAAQSSLIQAQKMAALGQLTAGIAHEIKNPLNFVNNFAGLSVELLDELKETAAPAIETLDENTRAEIDDTIEMLTGNLEKIVEHGQRADGIVKSMLEHSRGVTSERRKVDLNNLVEEALNLTYHGARAQDQSFNITLERDYEKDLGEIDIVPQEVNRVFINLIGNGFYAAHKRQQESGEAGFRPILAVATRDLGGVVEVRIRDNGIGIPAEIRDKLFQPFFTTKPTGEGTGLGLSISYDIVTQQHGGHIEVESQVGEFTEFIVRLPREYRVAAEAAS